MWSAIPGHDVGVGGGLVQVDLTAESRRRSLDEGIVDRELQEVRM